jgi:hypothetical protein
MRVHSIPLAFSVATGCCEFSEPDNSVWMGSTGGDIITCRLLDQRIAVLGSGYADPVAVLPATDGLRVFVIESTGSVLSTSRTSADRGSATVLADLGRPLASARLHPDGGLLVLASGDAADLLQIDANTGAVLTLASGLSGPTALAVVDRLGVIIQQTADGPQITTVDLDNAAVTPSASLNAASALVSGPAGASAIVVTFPAGDLFPLDLTTATLGIPVPIAVPVRAITRWKSLVLAVTDSSIEAIEWELDEGTLPIALPLGPLFVGGYARVELNLAAIGLSPGDVSLMVEEGPLAGSVSAAIEPLAPTGEQRLMVLSGYTPGEYHLVATRIADGVQVGRARFRVTRHWPDEISGPPVAITGMHQIFAEWGGGPPGAENIGVHAAPPVWRVAIVFCSTKDASLPPDLSPLDTEWRNRLTGPGGSVQGYYEEVSFHNTAGGAVQGTTMALATGKTYGPANVDAGWGDLFKYDNPKDTSKPFAGWNPKSTTWADFAGAWCDTLIDAGISKPVLDNTDAVVFVVQTASDDVIVSGDDTFRAKFVWPQANYSAATFHFKTVQSDGVETNGFKTMPSVLIPTRMPASMPVDQVLDLTKVLCHELGHTLGCEDLYNTDAAAFSAEVNVRLIDDLDPMGNEFSLPDFSLPNRMRLGWIASNWIETFDFSVNPTGHPVTLQAMETLTRSGPPAGRRAGIEIRIRDGWNYYFEYRRTQAAQIGDQGLNSETPGSLLVLGTDVIGDGLALEPRDIAAETTKGVRPRILRLPVDVDGDGPVLTAPNQDYAESDVTNPVRMHDFRLVFDQVDPADKNSVQVRVVYEGANRVDLRISPAPGHGNYKSPDIDLDGPAGPNVVSKGVTQTIKVRVHNAGSVAADNVVLKLAWLPFTTKPGDWNNLPGPPPANIPAGGLFEFQAPWMPPAELKIGDDEVEHFCIKAQVDAYVDPRDASHNEITVANNWAQSNFNTTAVAEGSPSERKFSGFTITNPLADPATYLSVAEQDSGLFRAYLGNAWLHLDTGETRFVPVAYESLAGDPVFGKEYRDQFGDLGIKPNLLSLTSFLIPPNRPGCGAPRPEWGTNLSIHAGHRTRVRDVQMLGEVVRGFVEGVIDGHPESILSGMVNVVLWLAEQPDRQVRSIGTLGAGGRFDAPVTPELITAFENDAKIFGAAFYLGTGFWAPSRMGPRQLR